MDRTTKSITVTRFDYVLRNGLDEELGSEGKPSHFTELDPQGNTLKEITYNSTGEFEEMTEYTYNESGQLEQEYYYPAESEIAEQKTYIRDEAGLVRQALKKYQDGSVDTIDFEYNAEGRVIRIITTNDEGDVDQTETFEWKNGELVSHSILDDQGEPLPAPDYSGYEPNPVQVTHNEQGQVIHEEELNAGGEAIMTVDRTYNDDGRPATVDVFIDGQGKTLTRHYLLQYEYTFFE